MRGRWLSGRAILLHLAVIVVAPGCLVAGWWQATVALSGNTLSFLYAVEWPVFAVIAVIMWWQLIHEDPEAVAARKAHRTAEVAAPGAADGHVGGPRRRDEEDEELRAYNDYLAGLAAAGKRKSLRNPRGAP